MSWREASHGAHVGPGWEPIVDQLYADLLAIDPNIRVDQVKEKFGGLRFYYGRSSELSDEDRDFMNTLLRNAEAEALQTCEACGQPGTQQVSERGWLKTLCDADQERRLRGERIF